MERLHLWKFDVNGSLASARNKSLGRFLNNLLSFAAVTKRKKKILSITQTAKRLFVTEQKETHLIKHYIKATFFVSVV